MRPDVVGRLTNACVQTDSDNKRWKKQACLLDLLWFLHPSVLISRRGSPATLPFPTPTYPTLHTQAHHIHHKPAWRGCLGVHHWSVLGVGLSQTALWKNPSWVADALWPLSSQPSHKLHIHAMSKLTESCEPVCLDCCLFFFVQLGRPSLSLWCIQRPVFPSSVWLKPNENKKKNKNKRSPKCSIAETTDCIMEQQCEICVEVNFLFVFLFICCPMPLKRNRAA